MTQMGLDYQKHLENVRHNQVTEVETNRSNVVNENIKQQTADAGTLDASTRAYTASFEPRRVAATEMQAKASQSQAASAAKNADTNRFKYNLDAQYRDREVAASEVQAAARAEKNRVAREANAIKSAEVGLRNAPKSTAKAKSMQLLGYGKGVQRTTAAVDIASDIISAVVSKIKEKVEELTPDTGDVASVLKFLI